LSIGLYAAVADTTDPVPPTPAGDDSLSIGLYAAIADTTDPVPPTPEPAPVPEKDDDKLRKDFPVSGFGDKIFLRRS
jgi:hypothetical protein